MSRAENPPVPVAEFTVERLRVSVYDDRAAVGRAAALEVVRAVAARQEEAGSANVVFAAAPSQNELLACLVASTGIDWSRVHAFHMDEYLGVDADHPFSFRRFLNERLFRLVGLSGDRLHLIPGEQSERPLKTCLDYEDQLRAYPTDVVCAGIGENGHLAFNDPPVADFLDPVLVKVIRLDPLCREQQAREPMFSSVDEVPPHGYTLTVPALLRAPFLAAVVPGPRKAEAVLNTLRGPYGESCPATALRRHPGARLYLDRESARLIL
jgi:glucosamine-6-phosphate deaminase